MEKIVAQNLQPSGKGMELLWQRKDIVLLASGSLTCVRAVYQRAVLHKALSRFRYVILRNEDYILGTAEEEIRRKVHEAAFLPGVRVVVIYLSCLDILIRLDFADMEERLSQETGCIVRCFFRGPLAKADAVSHEDAAAFLQTLPEAESEIDLTAGGLLPPPVSDVAGVSDACCQEQGANVLMTPSGCRSALIYSDMTKEQSNVYASEPHREDFIFGIEQTVKEDIQAVKQLGSYGFVNVLSSPVPAFMGVDDTCILPEKAVGEGKYFATDGFHDAVYGVAMAFLSLLQSAVCQWQSVTKTVFILGYSNLLSGDIHQFDQEIEYVHSLGYAVRFVGRDALNEKPELIWIVSAAGIPAAKWLGRCFGLPLLYSLPLGEHALESWKRQIQELMASGHGTRELKIHNMAISAVHQEKILMIGDPMATMAIGHALWHSGYHNQRQMAYAWTTETEDIYSQAPGAERLRYFQSRQEVQAVWDEADLVIADACLVPALGEKPIIPFPYGLFSGRAAVQPGSGVLGKTFLSRLQSSFFA